MAHTTQIEHELSEQLQQLLRKYDLSKWTFTDTIRIDASTVSHSHPVLTLNARWVGDDEQVLASFLHEQIHWF